MFKAVVTLGVKITHSELFDETRFDNSSLSEKITSSASKLYELSPRCKFDPFS